MNVPKIAYSVCMKLRKSTTRSTEGEISKCVDLTDDAWGLFHLGMLSRYSRPCRLTRQLLGQIISMFFLGRLRPNTMLLELSRPKSSFSTVT